MGGKVSAVSTTGHGAEFVVDLPVWRRGAKRPLSQPQVMVIDRDPQARDRIAALLSPLCELRCVAALEQAEDETTPVLLYTDAIGTEQAGAHGFTLLSKRGTGNDAFLRAVRLAANRAGD